MANRLEELYEMIKSSIKDLKGEIKRDPKKEVSLDKEFRNILLSKGYLCLPKKYELIEDDSTSYLLAMMLKSFESLGFTLDGKAIKSLAKLSLFDLSLFYHENFALLEEMTGANVKHIVFYSQFPDMKGITVEEYYINAVLHYMTSSYDTMGYVPKEEPTKRKKDRVNKNPQVLQLLSYEEGEKIVVQYGLDLLEQKVAISYTQSDQLDYILKHFSSKISPTNIPFHENVAQYIAVLYDHHLLENHHLDFVSNVNDILRIYAVISLATPYLKGRVNFISLPRKYRKMFIAKLEEIAVNNINVCEDFHRHEFLWKRALEKLHIGEYGMYPTIHEFARKFRNDEYKTYYGLLEENKDNQEEYLKLLSSRPGEFARRLDYILRKENFDTKVSIDAFSKIIDQLPNPLLLQLWKFFKNRLGNDERIIIYEKNGTKTILRMEENRAPIAKEVIDEVINLIVKTLKEHFAKFERIEKVYVDPNMKQYALPINCRNASSQSKTLTYGTRIPLGEINKGYMRFFTHWKNMKKEEDDDDDLYRVDIDLSLELVSDDFTIAESISWFSMNGGSTIDSYHSGDITSAPHGASEFIDLNVKKARKEYRYILVNNTVYTGQDFCDIPECFSGVMFLDKKAHKGSIFQPGKVKHKFTLTQKGAHSTCAYIVDLKTNELIWVDTPVGATAYNSIAIQQADELAGVIKDVQKIHMNFYDFLMLHEGHISFVDKKEDANFIISDEDGASLKPYDIETIASQWM